MAKRPPARTPKKDGVVRRPRNGANVNDSQSSRKATTRAQTAQDRPSQDQSNSKRKRSDYREPEGERKSRRIAGREAIDRTAQPTPQAEEDDESASQANTDTGNALPQASEPDSSVLRENQQERRRSVEFLDVLATNVIMYRNVRLLTADWNKWLKREADLRYGKDGLIDLEARIRTLGAEEGEGHQQEPEQARKNREDRLERINIAVDYLARLLGPMNEQNRWLYTRTNFQEEEGDNAAAAPLAGDKDAFAARFQYALQKVQECHDELYNIRRAPLSNATGLDSNAQGRLRVEKLGQRTQQLIAAEDEYRTYRDQALEVRAISEHHQSSRFRDQKDDGYGKESMALRGHPMKLSRAKHVQGWVERITGERAKDAPGGPKQRDRASEGNLWKHLTSVICDEDPDDTAIDRSRIRLDEWRSRCENLRQNVVEEMSSRRTAQLASWQEEMGRRGQTD